MSQVTKGNPAARWGLRLGAGVAAVYVLQSAMSLFGVGARFASLWGYLAFLIYLALYFGAGTLTARETGNVTSAAIAGLIAGSVGTAVGGFFSILVIAGNLHAYAEANGLTRAGFGPAAILILAVILLAIAVLLAAGFGAGLGALGGLVGRASHGAPTRQAPLYQPTPGGYPPPPAGQ
jgi:hypothetical protein